jgi:hypothetical protein
VPAGWTLGLAIPVSMVVLCDENPGCGPARSCNFVQSRAISTSVRVGTGQTGCDKFN